MGTCPSRHKLVCLFNPVIGFPLGNQDAVWSSYLGFGNEGTELVTRELFGKAVNEFGTAGVGSKVNTAGLEILKGLTPTVKQHLQDVVCHEVVDFAALTLMV